MALENIIKGLAAAVIAAGLYFGNACAAEPAPAKAPEPKQEAKLEQKKENSLKLELRLDYNKQEKGAGYTTSRTYVWQGDGTVVSGFPSLSLPEKTQVEDIIKDIKWKNINSYPQLVDAAKSLSEKQKIVLLGAVSNLMNALYEKGLWNDKMVSQDAMFSKLQDYLSSSTRSGIGVCRHIHSHVEKLAKDLGFKAAAVSGFDKDSEGHVYSIIKTTDGSAVIDYGAVLLADKNIEKTLEAYQKNAGTAAFQHLFFDDADFRYRLITKDGRNFLDFVSYDETSKPVKEILLLGREQAGSGIVLSHGNYSSSAELGWKGLFAKAGEIRGSSSSPLDNAPVFQLGYADRHVFQDAVNCDIDFSLVTGELHQDKKISDNQIFGMKGNLFISPYDSGPFNAVLRIGGCSFTRGSSGNMDKELLFEDFVIGAGASYKLSARNFSVEPYAVAQLSLMLPGPIDTYEYRPMLAEFGFGAVLSREVSDANVSVEPYYILRPWEHELGANAKFGKENFGISAGAHSAESQYEFCPDKEGFDIGLYANIKGWELRAVFEDEAHDYDGDKETTQRWVLGLARKF